MLLTGAMMGAVALALTACTAPIEPDSSRTSPAEVSVGIVTSQSGPFARAGKQYRAGFIAGLDYATKGTGKVGGTALDIEYKDDAGDPDTAVSAAKAFIAAGTMILAGAVSSDAAIAVAKQAGESKVLFVSGSATADALTGINRYTFRSGRQDSQDIATAGTILDGVKGKHVTVFAQNDAAGKTSAAEVRTVLGAQGAAIEPILVSEDATQFQPFAQQLLQSRPSMVFVAWEPAEAGAMWEAMGAAGVADAIPVATVLGDSATFGAYGGASDRIRFVSPYFPSANTNAVNTAMIDLVKNAGGTADPSTADGFTAALMVVHAVNAGKGDVDAMVKALEGFEFEGPKGKTTVRAADHALIQEMYRATLVARGGAFVPALADTVSAAEVAPAEAE